MSLILTPKTKSAIDNTFLKNLTPKHLEEKLAEAYLGILVNDNTIFNPLANMPLAAHKQLPEYILYLMSQPDYFYFLMRQVLQIESYPQQCLIIKELFQHRFPLLIGVRGLGKLLRPQEKIRIKNGWTTMEDISVGDQVYGSDGRLCNVIDKTALQKNVVMYRITLRDGRSIDCCEDHLWKVWSKKMNRKNKNGWTEMKTKDMVDSYFSVRKDSKSVDKKLTKEYLYALPVNAPLIDELPATDLPLHPYVVGVLLGDGSLTNNSIKITSLDQDLLDRFESLLPDGYKLSSVSNGKDYRIIRLNKNTPAFHYICKQAGIFGCYSHNKFIPEKYKYASYDQKLELIKGLMDTDGWSDNITIEYYTISNQLSDDFVDVLRSLGISCKHSVRESWLNGRRYADCNRIRIYTDRPIFSIARKLTYINHQKSKAGISKFEKVFITNIERIENGEGYCIQVDSPDNTYITKDYIVTHNSFALAVYIFLRMILIPDTKCIITAAGFRQAKVIFDYMETIWSKSEMLRNCFKGDKNGPKHGTDVWTFRLGNSVTYALPVGPDGSKVRGYRANCVDGRTLIQTDKGLIKISDYKDYHIFNINNSTELPSSFYKTELTDVYELTTELGYTIRFSKVHQLYINRAGVDQWAEAKDITSSDYVYLDNNDYFPSQTVVHNEIELTENHILYSGLINLSSLSAPEVPWYILQSPRKIVQSYLRILFGQVWLSKVYRSPHKYKVEQIQQLLLKFNFISSVHFIKNEWVLQVVGQHRDLGRPTDKVKSVIKLDKQSNLYDFVLDETHSFLGGGFVNHNCLINDEFATANRQVFEEVMSGFLSVASSPIEQVKLVAQQKVYKTLYIPIPKSSDSDHIQNQLILSGTAYYRMNHFYAYFTKWREIIKSKYDPRILNNLFENQEDREGINPDDYSIIRIPLNLVAGGYMDMAQVNRIKASTTKDVFMREYCSVFTNDSDGFFKKQLIDSCTIQDESDPDMFTPRLYGNKGRKHIFGIDPAYEGDNFAIFIIELDGPKRRVVYGWTTQASDHKERLKEGVITEQDYFHYCARKIRDLMKRFPCEYIAMDPLGGGRAVIEAFMDTSKLQEGELAILPTIEPEEETKETDLMAGLHIIKVINFTSDWIAQANYALKKDMEDKSIMFPFCDDIAYTLAEAYDESMGDNKTLWDTLDDCMLEIDELKKELITITVTETATGRERFDTPTTKMGINKKGRLKKDRYSALLLANWVGRSLSADYCKYENPDLINLAGFCVSNDAKGLFFGNNKTASKLEDLYRNL